MKRAFSCVLLFVLVGCSMSDSAWEYDANYTMDLVFNTSGYYEGNLPNSVVSVDVIQIYKPREKRDHVLPLKSLRRQPLIGELRKKDSIKTFFQSFQKVADHIDGCSISPDTQAVHIVAFDATLKRLAYFRYYLCSEKGAKFGIIRSLGDEGLFFNTSPPALMLEKLKW